jgi:hypothetical protein
MAQVIGYFWLAWTAYVILFIVISYVIAIPGINSRGGVGLRLFEEVLLNLIVASPAVFLVAWGRRRERLTVFNSLKRP